MTNFSPAPFGDWLGAVLACVTHHSIPFEPTKGESIWHPEQHSGFFFFSLPFPTQEMCVADEPLEEFTSRHSLEWKFLFLDHRFVRRKTYLSWVLFKSCLQEPGSTWENKVQPGALRG